MQFTVTSALLLSGFSQAAAHVRTSDRFLGSAVKMQPDLAAHSISRVEDEWRAMAAAFAECNQTVTDAQEMDTACARAPKAFQKSCATVVDSVLQASNGDRSIVQEYMSDVCEQPSLKGWKQAHCRSLADTVVNAMSVDAFDNRERLQGASLCPAFWQQYSAEEQARIAEERVAEEARAKKEREARAEAEKKAAEAAAAAAKAAEEARAKKAKEEAEERAKKAKMEAEAKAQKEKADKAAAEAAALKKKKEADEVAARAAAQKKEAVQKLKADQSKKQATKKAQKAKVPMMKTTIVKAPKITEVSKASAKANVATANPPNAALKLKMPVKK